MGCVNKPYPEQKYYSAETNGVGVAFGAGVEMLGIKQGSLVKDDIVQNLRDGKSPDGKKNYAYNVGREDRRDAYDVHFAPPKSVSIAAHLLPAEIADKAMKAHLTGVAAAMRHIENNYTYYRETKDNVTSMVKSDNLIAFQYTHPASRELDPQLGTHNLLINMTVTKDGLIKALETKPLMQAQKEINSVYLSTLAQELVKSGIKIDRINDDGSFEIAGISDEAISLFSKRGNNIEKKIEELKQDTTLSKDAVYQTAKLSTRPKKDLSKSIDELKADWNRQLADAHIDIEKGFETAQKDFKPIERTQNDINKIADNAVKIAINDLTKFQVMVKATDVINHALRLHGSVGNIDVNDVKKAIKRNTDIIKTPKKDGHIFLTSKEMIKLERSVMKEFQNGFNKVTAIESNVDNIYEKIKSAEKAISDKSNKNFELSTEQAIVIKDILSTVDTYHNVQGVAGAGKTAMLQIIKDIAIEKGYSVEAISFMGKAADEMRKALKDDNVKANTIDSFLSKEIKDNSLILIDESSMTDLRRLKAIQDKVKTAQNVHVHVVMIGDRRQNQSIDAGKAFAITQRHGFVKTSNISKSMRQKEENYKQVIREFENLSVSFAFEKMKEDGKIIEIADPDERLVAARKLYFENLDAKRDALIVTDTTETKEKYNETIHNILKQKGLVKNTVMLDIKKNKYLTPKAMRYAKNYSSGFLYLKEAAAGFGTAGTEYQIINFENYSKYEDNTVKLKKIEKPNKNKNKEKKEPEQDKERELKQEQDKTLDNNGNGEKQAEAVKDEIIFLDLADEALLKKIGGIYIENGAEFGIGDKIKFTKNDKRFGVKNGVTAIITNIRQIPTISNDTNFKDKDIEKAEQDYFIDFKDQYGEQKTIKLSEYNYIDYAYASTVVGSQGMTKDVVLADLDSNMVATFNKTYVAVSRGVYDYRVFTDDIEHLRKETLNMEKKTSTYDFAELQATFDKIEKEYQPTEQMQEQKQEQEQKEIINSDKKPTDKQAIQSNTKNTINIIKKPIKEKQEPIRQESKNKNDNVKTDDFDKYYKNVIKNKYQDKDMKDIADVVDNFIDDIGGKYGYSNYMGKSNVFDKAMGGIKKIIDDRVQGKKPAKNQDKINLDRDIKEIGENILADIGGQYGNAYNERYSNNIFEEALNELASKLEKKIEKAIKKSAEKIKETVKNGIKDIADDVIEIAETIGL